MQQQQQQQQQPVTVFFQGNQASRLQATKYCGKEGLDIYVTNNNIEHVYNPVAPLLLYNLFLYAELSDIEYGFSWNPIHWFQKLLHWARMWYFNVYGTSCVPHNNWSQLNIAGPRDVTQCANAIRACIKKHPDERIVLFGTSRGAATVLITLANLTRYERSHIGLVVAEAPFASVPSVLHATMPLAPLTAPLLMWVLTFFGEFRETQPSPLGTVNSEAFPLDIPLVFVTSETDSTVPVNETQQLIDVLKKRSHAALHHIELKRSHHSAMSLDNEADTRIYTEKLHDLYREYKLLASDH